MAFEDNDWGSSRTVVEYDGDRANLNKPTWTRWDIDLRRLVENNPTFRLDHVKKMSLGIGRRDGAQATGSGTIYFDDISIEYQQQPAGTAELVAQLHSAQPLRHRRPVSAKLP